MSIDTTIAGDPGSIHAVAVWLRNDLAAGVGDCVDQVHRARATAARGWTGDASAAFQTKLSAGAQKADMLAQGATQAAQALDRYATDLETAQSTMAHAREIAMAGGLTVTDATIHDPGMADTDVSIPASAAGSSATQQQAYERAHHEANRAREIVDDTRLFMTRVLAAITQNVWFDASDFVNGTIGELAAIHERLLLTEKARLLSESALAKERYLQSPGGSSEARFHTSAELSKATRAAEFGDEAAAVGRRFGTKVPIVGLAITAAGIGYDIHTGKPAGKAIISGVGGATAAMAAGALVVVVGAPVIVGLVAGIAVGAGAGVLVDAGYDALPPRVKDGIENGVSAVGDAIGGGAKKAWKSVFG